MSLYGELKRRNVFRVSAAYIIVGWLILQVGEVLGPALRLPEGLKLQKDVDQDKSIARFTGRNLNYWIIGLLAVALVFFAFDRFVLDPRRDAVRIEAAVQQAMDDAADQQQSSTPEPRAGEAYVLGRQLIHKRTRTSIKKAVEALQRAVEIDPGYASAHAQLAIAYTMMLGEAGSYGEWTLDEVNERATPHIERALALDPRLAEGHAAVAFLAYRRDQYDEAVKSALEALELNPSYAEVLIWLGQSYRRLGLYREYNETMARMLQVDPLSVVGRRNMAFLLARQGNLEYEIFDMLCGPDTFS